MPGPTGTTVEAFSELSTGDRLRMFAEMGAKIVEEYPQIGPEFTPFVENSRRYIGFLTNTIGDSPSRVGENLHTLHMLGLWASYGFNVFNLSHSLAAALILTDPPMYRDGEELQVPFPVFFITLPPGVLPVFTNGKQVWADTMTVYKFKALRKKTGLEEGFIRWSVGHRGLEVFRDRSPFHLAIREDEKIFNVPEQGDPPPVPEDDITLDTGLRLLRNLLLWLEATGGLRGRSNNRTTHKSRVKGIGKGPTTWFLGHEVKLSPQMRQAATELALGSSKHAVDGWKVRVRHVVRGHWKMQSHGAGRQERSRKWIEPYFRGPEGADAWSHIYTTK